MDSNGCIRVYEDGTSVFLDCNGNEIISGEDENGRLESAHSFWDEEIGVGIKYTRENSEEQEKIGFFTLYRFPVSMKKLSMYQINRL